MLVVGLGLVDGPLRSASPGGALVAGAVLMVVTLLALAWSDHGRPAGGRS